MVTCLRDLHRYIAPRLFASRLAGWLAGLEAGLLTKLMIRLFIRLYRVNLQEAQQTDLSLYPTFNAFFTRRLKPEARPLEEGLGWLLIPVDGIISQVGAISNGALLQAKGREYSLKALLAGDEQLALQFSNGSFATFYLAPGDYHRVHMPCAGVLRKVTYVPGTRFSVSPRTADTVDNLFARNERVITIFQTEFGVMAQILVGAAIVGSINLAWSGFVAPMGREVVSKDYPLPGAAELNLERGAEMGYFALGSTVINLFSPGRIAFVDGFFAQQQVKVGRRYARILG